MSDPIQFQRWLDSFRYKLGFQFRLDTRCAGGDMGAGYVRLSTKVRHRDKPEYVDEIHFSHKFYQWPKTVSEFLILMRVVIHQWEMHEADEWIRYGEERPFDPHEEPGRDYTKLVVETTKRREYGAHDVAEGTPRAAILPAYRSVQAGTFSLEDLPDYEGKEKPRRRAHDGV